MPLTDLLIAENTRIIQALKRLDATSLKLLLVVDETGKLLGALSDGDIRRYILKGNSIEDDVSRVYNRKPIYICKADYSLDMARKTLLGHQIDSLPVIDEDARVVDFIRWADVFGDELPPALEKNRIDVPLVIMAGGKGNRLDPFTRILPKPLIPLGDKPIIELIIQDFAKSGVHKFYLTLNYKGEMIEAYFNSLEKDYDIEFVWEKNFGGTAGSLKLLEKKLQGTFIVSNCDIIVKANYAGVLAFHRQNNASLTVVSSIQHHKVPYGVVHFKEGGEVTSIVEKPEYSLTINTGVYILEPECLGYLKEDAAVDMPALITSLMQDNRRVLTYPVNESDYIDIGQWDEYRKAVDKMRSL